MSALAEFEGGTRSRADQEPASKPLPVFAGAGDILADLGLKAPPVDIRAIVQHYGFRVEVSRSPNGYVGAVSFPERLILVDSQVSRQWQRFIVAHEFGHAILHRHLRNQFADRSDRPAGDPLEEQADEFAADLLIPKNWLLARLGHLSVTSLAQLFDVPVGAVQARVNLLRR